MINKIFYLVSLVIIFILCLFSYKTYNNYTDVLNENIILNQKYSASIENEKLLEEKIKEQNIKIEEYKNANIEMESKVKAINNTIVSENNQKEVYEIMEVNSSKEKDDENKEAILWLIEKSKSLVQ